MQGTPDKPQDHVVVVLGASPKPTRYSNMAVRQLQGKGYRVIPVHPKAEAIGDLPVVHSLGDIQEKVHTLTLYLGPLHSRGQLDGMLALAPKRVIFNPGTESRITSYNVCYTKLLRVAILVTVIGMEVNGDEVH